MDEALAAKLATIKADSITAHIARAFTVILDHATERGDSSITLRSGEVQAWLGMEQRQKMFSKAMWDIYRPSIDTVHEKPEQDHGTRLVIEYALPRPKP